MLTVFTNKWTLLLVNIILSFLFFFITAPTYNLLHYINTLFYICFLYVIFWVFSFILKGRFFDGIIYGFRKVGRRIVNKDYLEELEDKTRPSEKVSERFLAILFFQGVSLVVLLSGLMIVYYM